MKRYLLIAIGGAVGALLRYFIGNFAAKRFGPGLPIGTLTVNVVACCMIGFILEYLDQHTGLNPAWRYAFAIGFVGAFSTFSTFAWETWADFTSGRFWIGILYVAASLFIGLAAVGIGQFAARSVS